MFRPLGGFFREIPHRLRMCNKQQRTGGKEGFAVYSLYQVSLFFGFCQGKKYQAPFYG
jgi:hypothetical protein